MKKIEDERIISEKRKINSSAFGICYLALWGILIFRQFALKQNITEYMDIFLLTIGISIYLTINNVFKGYYLTYRSKQDRKKVNLIGALVGSITFGMVQSLVIKYDFHNLKDILVLIFSSFIFFIIWIISQSILLKISEKKANQDLNGD
ncbi:MAG: DUF6773 family protein [Eubacteriaceae bacterium]